MAKPLLDPTPQKDASGYLVTLTSSVGFNDDQESQIVEWHRRKCHHCMLVREHHKSGERHYHSTILVTKPKTANGLKRQLETLYKSMSIDPLGNGIDVRSTTDQMGSFLYLVKELDDDHPLLCIGWLFSWIKDQCVKNVKKIPRKLLMLNRVVLNPANAIPYCLKFAEASGIGVTGKESFKCLVRLMVLDGYSFDNTKFPWLYSQVMCICGDTRALDQQIDLQLTFLA